MRCAPINAFVRIYHYRFPISEFKYAVGTKFYALPFLKTFTSVALAGKTVGYQTAAELVTIIFSSYLLVAWTVMTGI
jgi:hypothetical protein